MLHEMSHWISVHLIYIIIFKSYMAHYPHSEKFISHMSKFKLTYLHSLLFLIRSDMGGGGLTGQTIWYIEAAHSLKSSSGLHQHHLAEKFYESSIIQLQSVHSPLKGSII